MHACIRGHSLRSARRRTAGMHVRCTTQARMHGGGGCGAPMRCTCSPPLTGEASMSAAITASRACTTGSFFFPLFCRGAATTQKEPPLCLHIWGGAGHGSHAGGCACMQPAHVLTPVCYGALKPPQLSQGAGEGRRKAWGQARPQQAGRRGRRTGWQSCAAGAGSGCGRGPRPGARRS